jgi:hypothetical protein
MSLLSQRDNRTEPGVLTPGIDTKMPRPEGAAVIRPSLHKSTDRLARPFCRPFGAGLLCPDNLGLKPQAESRSPFGTEVKSRQRSKSPKLRYSVRLQSTTACPTEPKLYSADRSSRPRKRGTVRKKDVGEVGRTRTPNAKRQAPDACTP